MTTKQADGITYERMACDSAVLAEISNTAKDFGLSEKQCWMPAHQDKRVNVYVLELEYTTKDFPASDQQKRFEFLSYPEFKPVESGFTHGEKVINILAGESFGVARSSKIHIIPVKGPKKDPNDNESDTVWANALKAIAKHFSDAQKKGVEFGVVNCSRALEKQGNVTDAFKECVKADLIMVGAAGNRKKELNIDDPNKSDWFLPEANDDTILIGSLDNGSAIYTGKPPEYVDGSSHGTRVDYWVRGVNLAYRYKGSITEKVNGTSFACPVAAGVIASMLSAGQVPSGKSADVRKKLDAWAVTAENDFGKVKMLRNAPGLN